jgi:hypothetical protein
MKSEEECNPGVTEATRFIKRVDGWRIKYKPN